MDPSPVARNPEASPVRARAFVSYLGTSSEPLGGTAAFLIVKFYSRIDMHSSVISLAYTVEDYAGLRILPLPTNDPLDLSFAWRGRAIPQIQEYVLCLRIGDALIAWDNHIKRLELPNEG